MPDTTPNLALPLIAANQAQKHVTHNEALIALDALVQLACRDKDLAAPPANPAEGDRYLVAAANPSGAWTGLSGQIACFRDGVWVGLVPKPGWFAFVADEAELYTFTGGAWVGYRTTITALGNLARLGVNTSADATNRLAVKSEAALLSWDDAAPGAGNMRTAINRKASANDAGFVFQTGYATRALFGNLGDDDLVAKVSPDGQGFREGLRIKAATGRATFPNGLEIPNRRTFTAVSRTQGQAVAAGGFVRVRFQGVDDAGGNWDAANDWYTCPRAGVYLITGSLRVDDGTAVGTQYGVGVYTAEMDGPWYLWHIVGPRPATRSTFAYSRIAYQNAGDRLRMFCYSDQGVTVSAAGLQVVLICDAA